MNLARTLNGRAAFASPAFRVGSLQLCALVMALALGVRLIGLGLRPLWLDEAYSAWFSSRGWHELWTLVPTYEPHPPFYYSLLKLWRSVAGGSPLALRGFSVLLSVATVPLVMLAANELERQKPTGRPLLRAGFAGFLAACSPMLLLLDQEARPYPLLIFAYALATLGLLRLMREFDEGCGRWSSWLLLGFGTELALWAHGLGLLYAMCLALALAPAWLKRPLNPRRLASGLTAAALLILVYAPCLLMMSRRVGDWGSGWLSWSPSNLLQLIGLYSVPYEALTAGTAVTVVAMLLLIKRALQGAVEARGWNPDKALLVLWWGPPLLTVAISVAYFPIFLPRTLSATLVPAYLAMSGAVAVITAQRERMVSAAMVCIPMLASTVAVGMRAPQERWDEVASYLNNHVQAGDIVWLYPNDSALPLREAEPNAHFVAHGVPGDYPAVGMKGPIRAGSPAVVSLTAEQAREIAADPRLARTPRIWLVTRQSGIFDPTNDLPKALARVRKPGPAQEWGYIAIQSYDRR